MSRILSSIHDRKLGLTHEGQALCPKGFVSGEHGKQFQNESPDKVVLLDDFLGDVVADQWNNVEGAGGNTDAAIVPGAIGGVLRLASGATGVKATDMVGVTHTLGWKAINGGLAYQIRFKPNTAIVNRYIFIGLTDILTVEAPITLSGTTFTAAADDAVGVLFDVDATTDTYRLVGVNATVKTTFDTGLVPVIDQYETWRIEVTKAGLVSFFRNGLAVNTGTTQITANVGTSIVLTPCVYASVNSAASKTLDVDYIHVSMNRGLDGTAV
jgi:hypothetical protein